VMVQLFFSLDSCACTQFPFGLGNKRNRLKWSSIKDLALLQRQRYGSARYQHLRIPTSICEFRSAIPLRYRFIRVEAAWLNLFHKRSISEEDIIAVINQVEEKLKDGNYARLWLLRIFSLFASLIFCFSDVRRLQSYWLCIVFACLSHWVKFCPSNKLAEGVGMASWPSMTHPVWKLRFLVFFRSPFRNCTAFTSRRSQSKCLRTLYAGMARTGNREFSWNSSHLAWPLSRKNNLHSWFPATMPRFCSTSEHS